MKIFKANYRSAEFIKGPSAKCRFNNVLERSNWPGIDVSFKRSCMLVWLSKWVVDLDVSRICLTALLIGGEYFRVTMVNSKLIPCIIMCWEMKHGWDSRPIHPGAVRFKDSYLCSAIKWSNLQRSRENGHNISGFQLSVFRCCGSSGAIRWKRPHRQPTADRWNFTRESPVRVVGWVRWTCLAVMDVWLW